jgi:hypothetical protein
MVQTAQTLKKGKVGKLDGQNGISRNDLRINTAIGQNKGLETFNPNSLNTDGKSGLTETEVMKGVIRTEKQLSNTSTKRATMAKNIMVSDPTLKKMTTTIQQTQKQIAAIDRQGDKAWKDYTSGKITWNQYLKKDDALDARWTKLQNKQDALKANRNKQFNQVVSGNAQYQATVKKAKNLTQQNNAQQNVLTRFQEAAQSGVGAKGSLSNQEFQQYFQNDVALTNRTKVQDPLAGRGKSAAPKTGTHHANLRFSGTDKGDSFGVTSFDVNHSNVSIQAGRGSDKLYVDPAPRYGKPNQSGGSPSSGDRMNTVNHTSFNGGSGLDTVRLDASGYPGARNGGRWTIKKTGPNRYQARHSDGSTVNLTNVERVQILNGKRIKDMTLI